MDFSSFSETINYLSSSKKFSFYLQQSFSLPDTIIYNITQKPSNPKAYQKLIQTCKYFFAKNPLLVFHCLWHRLDEKWITCSTTDCSSYKKVHFNQATATKIWVTKYLAVWSDFLQSQDIASSVFSRLYKYDCILNLDLTGQIIYETELLLFPKLEKLSLNETTVLSKNNSVIPVEKILEYLPKLNGFQLIREDDIPDITSSTVKEILKNRNLHKFQFFILENIPECFDINAFYEYLKENEKTQFHLKFSKTISAEFQSRLETIVGEILQNEFSNYVVPYINFYEINYSKQEALRARLSIKTYIYHFFIKCVHQN